MQSEIMAWRLLQLSRHCTVSHLSDTLGFVAERKKACMRIVKRLGTNCVHSSMLFVYMLAVLASENSATCQPRGSCLHTYTPCIGTFHGVPID
jgi:hypothetical protein